MTLANTLSFVLNKLPIKFQDFKLKGTLCWDLRQLIISLPLQFQKELRISHRLPGELYWEMILYLRLSGLLELLLAMNRRLNLQIDSDPNQLQGKQLMHARTHTHTCMGLYTCLNGAFFLSWLCQVLGALHELCLVVAGRDYSFSVMQGLLIVVASLVVEQGSGNSVLL